MKFKTEKYKVFILTCKCGLVFSPSFHLPLSPDTACGCPHISELPCFSLGVDSPRLPGSVPAAPLLAPSPCCSLSVLHPRWETSPV